jgi:hypothetical protein
MKKENRKWLWLILVIVIFSGVSITGCTVRMIGSLQKYSAARQQMVLERSSVTAQAPSIQLAMATQAVVPGTVLRSGVMTLTTAELPPEDQLTSDALVCLDSDMRIRWTMLTPGAYYEVRLDNKDSRRRKMFPAGVAKPGSEADTLKVRAPFHILEAHIVEPWTGVTEAKLAYEVIYWPYQDGTNTPPAKTAVL